LLPRESFRVVPNYVYDDKGERIMKSSVIQSNVYVNDQIVNTIQDLEPYTLYVNPYFVITEFSNADKVSKHYYMGTQRVASELAVQTTSYSPLVSHSGSSSSASSSTESFKTQTNTGSTLNQGLESALPQESSNPWLNNLNEALANFGEDQLTMEETQKDLPTIESIYPDLSPTTSYKTTTTTRVIYWYHPDYIGNVDLVSDNSGEAYEFFLYNPWGESLYEWNSGTASFSSPYRFNGKELDQETGLYYYGARYYNPQTSVWLSVDPLASERPWMSPYNFVQNNPIMRIDPDGRLDTEFNVDKETGKMTKVSDKGGDETDYYNVGTTNSEGKFETDQTITIDRPEGGGNINSFRFKETENSTTSTFNMPGEDVEGFMLEPAGPSTTTPNQDKRIPEGQYNLEDYSSSNYPDNFRVYSDDVPKSRRILIHKGNYPSNTEGCLMPGCSTGPDAVLYSGKKFNQMRPVIKRIGSENVKLNIYNIID